jgi:hypothetical protein
MLIFLSTLTFSRKGPVGVRALREYDSCDYYFEKHFTSACNQSGWLPSCHFDGWICSVTSALSTPSNFTAMATCNNPTGKCQVILTESFKSGRSFVWCERDCRLDIKVIGTLVAISIGVAAILIMIMGFLAWRRCRFCDPPGQQLASNQTPAGVVPAPYQPQFPPAGYRPDSAPYAQIAPGADLRGF